MKVFHITDTKTVCVMSDDYISSEHWLDGWTTLHSVRCKALPSDCKAPRPVCQVSCLTGRLWLGWKEHSVCPALWPFENCGGMLHTILGCLPILLLYFLFPFCN